MSMYAYETLYCSSVSFGMRKALQAQEGKTKLQGDAVELEAEKKRLENEISAMKIKADQTMRRNAELRSSEEKKHAEEIVFLKKTSAQLKVSSIGLFGNVFDFRQLRLIKIITNVFRMPCLVRIAFILLANGILSFLPLLFLKGPTGRNHRPEVE